MWADNRLRGLIFDEVRSWREIDVLRYLDTFTVIFPVSLSVRYSRPHFWLSLVSKRVQINET